MNTQSIPFALRRLEAGPDLRAQAFSKIWSPPPRALQALRGHCVFTRIDGFPIEFQRGDSAWLKRWAALVLTPPERENWVALERSPRGRVLWLWGQTAAKEAVRILFRDSASPLGAAEVVLDHEAGGRPFVAGGWNGTLPGRPSISIAHTVELAVAMACDAQGISVGIDAERVQTPSDTLREATLSSEEARLLPRDGDPDAWFFRVWAAKEAVGKALGTGVVPDPKHFGVQRVDPESGAVELRTEAGMATAMTFEHRSKVNEENYALAVCQWVTGEV